MSQSIRDWARSLRLPICKEGRYIDGIRLKEYNRATVFERRQPEIEILSKIRDSYRRKGILATLVGIERGNKDIFFAVYVEAGFLREIGSE